ncbi:MAG: hypothetical protein IJT27_04745 [Clostridia bacterium]|nr:hypothetical protein [Clostridia bacterium]
METMKKCLAIFLVLIFVLSTGGIPAALAAENTVAPIVYVYGYQGVYVFNEDGSYYTPIDANKAPPETDDGDIVSAAIPKLIPLFAQGLITDNYDAYCDKALELLMPIYAEVKPNPDGTVPDNTGPLWTWSYDTLEENPDENTIYGFSWDTRLSPLAAADRLDEYIKAIQQKTGCRQVTLVSRCAGTEAVAAYLWKYQQAVDYADVKKCIFIANTLDGYDFFEVLLSGNITGATEALYRYVKQKEILENHIDSQGLLKLVNAMFSYLESSYGLDVAMEKAVHIYAKIKDRLIAPLLKEFYAISLGEVGTINRHYEEYKDYIFCEEGDREKYAAIIAKADEYHYNVQVNIRDMLQEMNDAGATVYFIGGYGEQQYPLGDFANYIGDEYSDLASTTFGATIAKVAEKLPADYLAAQEAAGLGACISPDRQVDVSTCMFPEQTWIVKNLRHTFGGDDLTEMIRAIARTDNATVTTVEGYPQFLNANKDHSAMEPAKAVNDNDVNWKALSPKLSLFGSIFAKLSSFFKKIILQFKSIFQFITAGFSAR